MSAQAINLLPDFSRWVDLQVMTQDEAQELQALFQAMRDGQTLALPSHLWPAMENLGLHQLVNEATAMRH